MPSNDIGTEWLIDATGCRGDALRDSRLLLGLCRQIVTELDLHAIGEPAVHKFPPPGGITLLFLLMESHLTCHTYPEFGVATFNLYCCRARPDWPWQARLEEALGAAAVSVRRIVRAATEQADAETARAVEGRARQ